MHRCSKPRVDSKVGHELVGEDVVSFLRTDTRQCRHKLESLLGRWAIVDAVRPQYEQLVQAEHLLWRLVVTSAKRT